MSDFEQASRTAHLADMEKQDLLSEVMYRVMSGDLPVSATNDLGQFPVVSMLESETMGALVRNLGRARGVATVVVHNPDGVAFVCEVRQRQP